jgi:hypothetical protein
VPAQRARGLMWLSMAREAAQGRKDDWIVALYEKAWATASEEDRAAAMAQASQTTAQVTGSARRRR